MIDAIPNESCLLATADDGGPGDLLLVRSLDATTF